MRRPKFKVNDRVLFGRNRSGTIKTVKRCRDYYFIVSCDDNKREEAYLENELRLEKEEKQNEL